MPVPSAKRLRSRLLGALRLYAKLGLCHFFLKAFVGYLRRLRMSRVLRDVPYANTPHHALLGFMPGVIPQRKQMHHWRQASTLGLPVSKLFGPAWDPSFCYVTIRDPMCLRHVLKDGFDKYTKFSPDKDWLWYHINRFLGKGIFTALHGAGAPDGGAFWLQQRKIASGIFSRANFNENMGEVFIAKARRLRDSLQTGQRVDMQLQFFNFTMDSIMKIFFGEESNIIAGQASVYGSAFDNAHRCFFKYVVHSQLILSLSRLLPWPFGGIHGLAALLHRRTSSVYRDFYANVSILNAESERLIERCEADPAMEKRRDLLALFLQAIRQEGMPKNRTTRYLQDVVTNFVIAGRDTTACALSWMFYILATNPGVQERVIAEIDQRLPAGTTPTWKALHHSNMPVLHALMYETLRLYPPVPFNGKEAVVDDVLPNGVHVPAHTKVIYFPWGMGRDPEIYADPERVHLDRWVPFKQPPAHEFPVFQAGPRICLGMDMAQFEVKLVAVMLLQEFSFSMAPEEAEKIHYSLMITMSICNSKEQDSHNLWLVPHKRRPAPAAS